MAQLERPHPQPHHSQSQRHVETTKSPTTIHTMEQLLRGESSKSRHSPTYSSPSSANSSSPSSPFFQRLRHHDSEEDHSQNHKKSVLTKVKEKAKKLRHSLSKRKHDDVNATSPSSATPVEADGAEEDAEYLGAPMYESEKAPSVHKANPIRHPNPNQSPRGNPMFPEKHAMSSNDKHVLEPDHQDKTLARSISKRTTTQPSTMTTSPRATTSTSTSTSNINANTLSGLNKTMTETVAKKPTPVHTEKPDATHVTSKMQGLTLSKPTEHHQHRRHHHHNHHHHDHHDHTSPPTTIVKTTRNTSLSHANARTPPAKLPSQAPLSTPRTTTAPVTVPSPSSAPAAATASGKNTSTQIWDKGVSMKEYFLNKLEPGEDEKALSQVISEAMSPRRTPGDAGVMEKVREAVTSLLRTDEPTKYADSTNTRISSQMSPSTNTPRASPSTNSPRASPSANNLRASSSQILSPSTNTPRASSSQMSTSTYTSQIPVSTNPHQDYAVAEEENHGRILQAN